ncbi:hypothetical protein Pelo_1737 [Pelomyxa schiedti]|nr:hypothetical protein Pelo_1737 [Pelomyxa schiedti]
MNIEKPAEPTPQPTPQPPPKSEHKRTGSVLNMATMFANAAAAFSKGAQKNPPAASSASTSSSPNPSGSAVPGGTGVKSAHAVVSAPITDLNKLLAEITASCNILRQSWLEHDKTKSTETSPVEGEARSCVEVADIKDFSPWGQAMTEFSQLASNEARENHPLLAKDADPLKDLPKSVQIVLQVINSLPKSSNSQASTTSVIELLKARLNFILQRLKRSLVPIEVVAVHAMEMSYFHKLLSEGLVYSGPKGSYSPMKNTAPNLFSAAFTGNIPVASVKATPQSVLDPDDKGNTPIHLACLTGNLEMLKLLLDRSATSDIPPVQNHSFLNVGHLAILAGNVECLDALISHGAKQVLCNRDTRGRCVAHYTYIYARSLPHFQILCQRYPASVTVQSSLGFTIFHALASLNDPLATEFIKVGLETPSIDPNILSTVGESILHIAVKWHNYSTMQVLLQCDRLDPNLLCHNFTPLHHAVRNYDENAVKILLSAPTVRPNTLAEDAETALQLAVWRLNSPSSYHIVDLLLEHPEVLHPIFLEAAALIAMHSKHFNIIPKLISLGSNITDLLFSLVENNMTDVLDMIVNSAARTRCDATRLDQWGKTPLHYAKSATVARDIISLGANINASCSYDGETPLIMAVKNKNSEVVRFMLSCNGIDVAMRDRAGRNALYWAMATGDFVLVRDFIAAISKYDLSVKAAAEAGQAAAASAAAAYANHLRGTLSAATTSGWTLLHLLMFCPQLFAHTISIPGVDLNTPGAKYSLLHLAAHGFDSAVSSLLHVGLDPKQPSMWYPYATPFKVATNHTPPFSTTSHLLAAAGGNTSNENSQHVQCLPVNILRIVFKYLSVKEVNVCAMTCKHWYNTSQKCSQYSKFVPHLQPLCASNPDFDWRLAVINHFSKWRSWLDKMHVTILSPDSASPPQIYYAVLSTSPPQAILTNPGSWKPSSGDLNSIARVHKCDPGVTQQVLLGGVSYEIENPTSDNMWIASAPGNVYTAILLRFEEIILMWWYEGGQEHNVQVKTKVMEVQQTFVSEHYCCDMYSSLCAEFSPGVVQTLLEQTKQQHKH